MKRKVFFILSSIIFLLLFSPSTSFASSEMNNYDWQKLYDYHTGRDIYDVAYNGTIFVAVGQKGLVLESEDGIYWSYPTISYEEDLCKIEWDGKIFTAVSRSGRMFIRNATYDWTLSASTVEPVAEESLSVDSEIINFPGKLYSFAKGKKNAVAVGESGNIFYGVEKGRRPLKQDISFDNYYREYLKRIGNSTVLYLEGTKIYGDNNLIKDDIPAPFIENLNKNEVVYVPAEDIVKALGGQFTCDPQKSSVSIKINNTSMNYNFSKKLLTINEKATSPSNPFLLKNKVVYMPIDTLELFDKSIFIYEKLVVISDVKEILNTDYDDKIIEGIIQIFENPSCQKQSLSECVINSLVEIASDKVNEKEYEAAKEYLLAVEKIEPSSEIYSYLMNISREQEMYNEAGVYGRKGLYYNLENGRIYLELMYVYCNSFWFNKAAESLNKAVSLYPEGTDFKAHIDYLNSCKGPDNPVIEEFTVSNYKELAKAIGSNRRIRLLPGDYNPKDFRMKGKELKDIKNLTIIGAPINGEKYIDFNNKSYLFQLQNCYKVNISNINFSNQISFENSSDIFINNCKIFYESTDDGWSSGLYIQNVNNFTGTNSYIESKSGFILDIFSFDQVEFNNCIMKGYTLRIGDSYYESPNQNLSINNCRLINDAGICSVWSNYVPIKEESGYEIFLGTETWNEWRFLAAIKYIRNDEFELTYENTYDGNDEIYLDGKFINLADKLNTRMNGKAFPSIDYIVGEDEDYNAYYDFYGTPELKKLNINLCVESLSDVNLENMLNMIKQLKPIQQDILAYSWPITVAYRLEGRRIVAVAEFSNESFKKFLNSEDNSNIEDYCTIMLTDICSTVDFFDISVKSSESKVIKELTKKFLTKSLTVKPNDSFGQINSILFTIKDENGIFYISALESFTGMGDFMHYITDVIIKTDAITGEHYIALNDRDYKLLDTNAAKEKDLYRKPIFEQLDSNQAISKKITGTPCKDVLLFIENGKPDKELSFVFLSAQQNETDGGYDYAEYDFYYYIGTYDLISKKVTDVRVVDIVDYDKILYD